MEHDEMGCKHSGCECKTTQQSMMGQPPSLSSLIFSGQDTAQDFWEDRILKVGRIRINIENPKIVPGKTFTKEYEKIEADRLFSLTAESLQKMNYFKVWTLNKTDRSIVMTTYGTSLIKDGWREQVKLKIEQVGTTGSVVRVEVTPSLEPAMFSWMAWHRKGVIERIADSIARMIFESLDERIL